MYVSLLQCLPSPVLNRPTAQGLSGRWRYTPDWLVLAARAGFATTPYAVSSYPAGQSRHDDESDLDVPASASRHSILVVAGRVFGDPVDQRTAEAARRLADLAELSLLGLQLAITDDGAAWFESADLYPDLRTGGDGLLDHIAGLPGGDAPA